MKRTFNSETVKNIGKEVKVCGWAQTLRSHGKILFIDLRDITGILQMVFVPQQESAYKIAKKIRPEWVIEVSGQIMERPIKMVNPKVETGRVELLAKEIKVLSKAKTLPFDIGAKGYEIGEEKRMQYRYLDLRRQRMKRNPFTEL